MSSLKTNHALNRFSKSCTNVSGVRFPGPERLCSSPETRPRRRTIRFESKQTPMNSSLSDLHKSRESLVDENGQPKRGILRKNSFFGSFPSVGLSSMNGFPSRENLIPMSPLVRERINEQHTDNLKVGPTLEIKGNSKKVGVDFGVNTEISIPPSRNHKVEVSGQSTRRKTLRELISTQPIAVQAEMIETLEPWNINNVLKRAKFGMNVNARR